MRPWASNAVKRLHRTPQEALLCAKAKRQQQRCPVGTEINHTFWRIA
ncbi:hypothetical protein [Lysinibacillus sp. G4S2]|nr:hypothetical protein [Lysinibacillus sp. G4S2]MDM5248280.1 hypothetical protein [Lysinibacillus sp. G4S2]